VLFSRVERKAVPIHDWTRVEASLFHSFHQSWITYLISALNRRVLPPGYFALADQPIQGPIPDVLALRLSSESQAPTGANTGIAVAISPPRTRLVRRAQSEANIYARKANRITVRHRRGRIVAVVEIVSPGNKGSTDQLRSFVEKTSSLIVEGVHVLVIDLFPPSKRDPQGIHKAIWDKIEEEDFELPADKPLVLVAYEAGSSPVAYIEPVAVGDVLPDMPIFLEEDFYVPAPLEATYQTAWDDFPTELAGLLETPSVNPPGNP
jgi:Protein of unknown function (DUF4058)